MTRDRQRRLAVEVFLHERQREVHTRGNTSRCPDRPVAQEDRLGIHVHRRVASCELSGGRPVRRRAPAVEQPSRGEQEGAGTDRGGAPGGGSRLGDPVQQRAVGCGLAGSIPARDDQRVDRGERRGKARVRGHGQPAGSFERPAVDAEQLQLVAALAPAGLLDQPLSAREHLQRTGEVEALHSRVDEDRDLARADERVRVVVRSARVSLILRSSPNPDLSARTYFPRFPAMHYLRIVDAVGRPRGLRWLDGGAPRPAGWTSVRSELRPG